METVGMENLSSAAAQGEQAFDPHHANGYNFTGAGPNVQTLEDAARHPLTPGTGTAVRGPGQDENADRVTVIETQTAHSETATSARRTAKSPRRKREEQRLSNIQQESEDVHNWQLQP